MNVRTQEAQHEGIESALSKAERYRLLNERRGGEHLPRRAGVDRRIRRAVSLMLTFR